MTAKDIISRDTLKRLTTDFARHLLGIEAEAVEVLETQNQRIEDRRADLVARMRATDGAEFLLHVEIANNNCPDMSLRMLRYYSDIRLAGHSGSLKQFLTLPAREARSARRVVRGRRRRERLAEVAKGP